MNQFTPAQNKAIETWTEQRDSLLREIGILTTQKQEEEKNCKEASESLRVIEKKIAESLGRLNELNELEKFRQKSVSKEVSDLEARKSRLEAECTEKEKEIKMHENESKHMVDYINLVWESHEKMATKIKVVDEVASQVIQNSERHISNMQRMMTDVDKIVTQVVDKSSANIEQTNIVLEKLPKYIFELEKPIPLRRTFKAPPKAVIPPDKE